MFLSLMKAIMSVGFIICTYHASNQQGVKRSGKEVYLEPLHRPSPLDLSEPSNRLQSLLPDEPVMPSRQSSMRQEESDAHRAQIFDSQGLQNIAKILAEYQKSKDSKEDESD